MICKICNKPFSNGRIWKGFKMCCDCDEFIWDILVAIYKKRNEVNE